MLEKCSGVKEGKPCLLKDKCLRYRIKPREDQLYLSFAPFEENRCGFFYDIRRIKLQKREGHLRFDNSFEYVYTGKEFVRYRIDWKQMRSVGQPFKKFL